MDATAVFWFCAMCSVRLAWRAYQRKCDSMETFSVLNISLILPCIIVED